MVLYIGAAEVFQIIKVQQCGVLMIVRITARTEQQINFQIQPKG